MHTHTQPYSYTHTHTHTHPYSYTHTFIHTHKHTHSYTHTHTTIQLHTHTHSYTHTHTHNTHTHSYTHTLTHTHTHTLIHTHTHSYTHTHMRTHTHTRCSSYMHQSIISLQIITSYKKQPVQLQDNKPTQKRFQHCLYAASNVQRVRSRHQLKAEVDQSILCSKKPSEAIAVYRRSAPTQMNPQLLCGLLVLRVHLEPLGSRVSLQASEKPHSDAFSARSQPITLRFLVSCLTSAGAGKLTQRHILSERGSLRLPEHSKLAAVIMVGVVRITSALRTYTDFLGNKKL